MNRKKKKKHTVLSHVIAFALNLQATLQPTSDTAPSCLMQLMFALFCPHYFSAHVNEEAEMSQNSTMVPNVNYCRWK